VNAEGRRFDLDLESRLPAGIVSVRALRLAGVGPLGYQLVTSELAV
jgi:hypothetical protein